MRGWVKVLPILIQGLYGNTLNPTRPGQGNEGSAEPIRRYRTVIQYSAGHVNPMGVGFCGGDTALVAGGRSVVFEGDRKSVV